MGDRWGGVNFASRIEFEKLKCHPFNDYAPRLTHLLLKQSRQSRAPDSA